ncbi:MAG: hypothetical protein KC910_22380, partial [Candidatus Eremiobacteraeota bacterium]|nr:hypothetical protein [Candidatus Eremiobacteraeota bacterium]
MKLTNVTPQTYTPARAAKEQQPAPPAQDQPSDSFVGRARKEIGAGMVGIGNDMSLAVGGGTGIVTAIAGGYAGVVGGAILGTAIGGGLGPAVASVSTHGVMAFLGTSLTTAAYGAQAGILIGGAAGIVGGYKVGKGLGSLPAKAIQWTGKKILGYDPDAGRV